MKRANQTIPRVTSDHLPILILLALFTAAPTFLVPLFKLIHTRIRTLRITDKTKSATQKKPLLCTGNDADHLAQLRKEEPRPAPSRKMILPVTTHLPNRNICCFWFTTCNILLRFLPLHVCHSRKPSLHTHKSTIISLNQPFSTPLQPHTFLNLEASSPTSMHGYVPSLTDTLVTVLLASAKHSQQHVTHGSFSPKCPSCVGWSTSEHCKGPVPSFEKITHLWHHTTTAYHAHALPSR